MARQLYSARFLAQLSKEEAERLDFRPVEMSHRWRQKRYFELCCDTPVPYVGVAGLDSSGWECTKCNGRFYTIFDPLLNKDPNRIDRFVCRADLPTPQPGLFVVGTATEPKLVATAERARQFLSSRRLKGLLATRLGVIGAAQCVRYPKLAIRGKVTRCPSCARWPKPVDIAREDRRSFPIADRGWSRANWTWIEPAIAEHEIILSRQTLALGELLADETSPLKTGVLTFRCPECMRLGYLSRSDDSVTFQW